MKTGIELITEERTRQRDKLWGDAHDDCHEAGVLAQAGSCYIQYAADQLEDHGFPLVPNDWPFQDEWWKPSDDPIRNMQKGAAMVSAEMDRTLRQRRDE